MSLGEDNLKLFMARNVMVLVHPCHGSFGYMNLCGYKYYECFLHLVSLLVLVPISITELQS